ncbi:hypothetical protein AMTR_s00008p00147830 [Amborella trichopoda]|uniref:Uncharacterized protein n=1 Tax=Amborella trichopoda TaxID=13333 RepID=W1NIJ7_AMBTC|nr:hypothetical protein AMTR_s00008p00147830 [Amborella trichopoda]
MAFSFFGNTRMAAQELRGSDHVRGCRGRDTGVRPMMAALEPILQRFDTVASEVRQFRDITQNCANKGVSKGDHLRPQCLRCRPNLNSEDASDRDSLGSYRLLARHPIPFEDR